MNKLAKELKQITSSAPSKIWCFGPTLVFPWPRRSAEAEQTIQEKWDARKQRRVLAKNITPKEVFHRKKM